MREFWPHLLLVIITPLMALVLALVFGDTLLFPFTSYVPTETSMGIVQRIFYFHVPAAITAYLAFAVAFVGSILYLVKRKLAWDNLAHSSVEIGVLFNTMVLVSGPLWARPSWGTWWPWDPRTTTFLIMWLMYVAYLLLRAYVPDREQCARFSAVLAIVAALNIPLVYYSVQWWRSIHPVVFGPKGGGIEPRMQTALLLALLTFFLLYGLLLVHRTRLARLEDQVADLRSGLD